MRCGAGIASGKIQLGQCPAVLALWHSLPFRPLCNTDASHVYFRPVTVMADQRPTYTVAANGWPPEKQMDSRRHEPIGVLYEIRPINESKWYLC
jgi:hypothetical protein